MLCVFFWLCVRLVDRLDRFNGQNVRVGDGLSLHDGLELRPSHVVVHHEIGGNSLELVVMRFENARALLIGGSQNRLYLVVNAPGDGLRVGLCLFVRKL